MHNPTIRDEVSARERAAYTTPSGDYTSQPPSDEALRDLVDRADNAHGSWVSQSPGGYWLDVVAMGRETIASRELADAVADFHLSYAGPPPAEAGPYARILKAMAALGREL